MSSHTKTIANHILVCPFQSDVTKQEVLAHKEKYSDSTTRSPGRQCTLPPIPLTYNLGNPERAGRPSLLTPGQPALPLSDPFPPVPVPGSSSVSRAPSPSFISLNSPTIPHSQLPRMDHQLQYPQNSYSRSRTPSDVTSSFDHESLHPSKSASQISYRSGPSSRPPSQLGRRRGSYMIPPNVPGELLVPVWSPARVKAFEHKILRLTASAGFPLSWVENPEFHALQDEFITGSPRISRKVLTKRILCDVVTEFHEVVKQQTVGKEATIQSDGWTGINNHHLVAFMITADKKVRAAILSTCDGPDLPYIYSRSTLLMFMIPHAVERRQKFTLQRLKTFTRSSRRNGM